MLYLITLFALSLPSHALAQEILRWYPNTARFPEGECVRLHAPSGGDSYVEKVKPEECRPSAVSYYFTGETCYEVDRETQGKAYGVKLKTPHPCAPSDALYSFDPIRQHCYLVDPSGGLKFKAKIETKECKPNDDELSVKFIFSREKMSGECFEVHVKLGEGRWKRPVELIKCRPARTYFSWRALSQFKGDCFEISSEGPENYLSKSYPKNCKPEQTVFQFERKSEKSGDCYELDAETQGQKFSQKVQPSSCR